MREVHYIPVDLVEPGAFQARRSFDQASLEGLAASIAESGVIQPVVVRHRGGVYELLAGERRWRATQLAGLAEIPAVIRDDLTDHEASVLGLIENLQRESLNVTETARGLKALCVDFGMTHDQVATQIGKSRVYVTNYLRILQLSPAVQAYLDDGSLTLGHGKVLAGLPRDRQLALASETVRRQLSVRALERRVTGAKSPPARSGTSPDRHLANLQDRLSDALGNRVVIDLDSSGQKGSLTIRFHSLVEFEGILDRLGFDGEDS